MNELKQNASKPWEIPSDQLYSMYSTSENGLDDSSVEQIREQAGENVLSEGKKKSVLQVFFSQFLDLLVIILIIAAIVSMASGSIESTLVIFMVLICVGQGERFCQIPN